jgi:hypothetical protein
MTNWSLPPAVSLETARAEGFDADASIFAPSDRAHFFPTEAKMPMQLVFDRKSLRVLGVQAFGAANDAVLAWINAAANVAIKDFLDWIAAPSSQPDRLALDIRHPKEVEPFARNSAIFGWASPTTRYAGTLTNCPWTKP